MQFIFKGKENHSKSKRYKCILGFGLVFFSFLLSSPNRAFSQYYNTGVENGKTKFREIKTEKFQIIYPDFYETKAQEFANVLDTVYGFVGKSLKTNVPNVPFLLHINTSYANGLSVWAPKRIELWTTTHPSNYAYPWMWQLAIHEWRHSAQVYALNKGLSKHLVNIFGEHIYGLILGGFVPNWFLEGDAVVAETALSATGRGKTPDYNMYLKAQVLDKGKYSYDKAILGSMKDYVPNSYIIGYNMVSFGREKYERDIWGDILENVGRNFWKLQFFGRSEKRDLKINKEALYNEMIDSLKKQWGNEDEKYYKTNKEIFKREISPKQNYYSNYLSPQKLNDSTIIAIKTSSFYPPTIQSISFSKEKTITPLGQILNSYFDITNQKILFSEYRYHHRWEHESYADIVEYDIKEEKYNYITKNKRVYTPSYNPNNENIIAAIYEDSINNQHLVIIDKTTGNILQKFINEKSYDKFSYPSWNNKADEIYLIKSNEEGKSIGKYNIYNHNYTQITTPSYNNISKTKYHNNRIYFIGDYNNTYQVYSFETNKEDPTLKLHTQMLYGVMDYSFFEDSLIISEYSAEGAKIILQSLESIETIAKDQQPAVFPFAEKITVQENFSLTKEKINNKKFPSQKYSKAGHLFKFHSWAPLYINVENQDINFGLSAFSQNLLGTSILMGGYKYLFEENRDEYFIDYTYKGWYPIINFKFNYSQRNISYSLTPTEKDYSIWNEYNNSFNIELPYSHSKKNYHTYLNTKLLYSYRIIDPIYNYSNKLNNFNILGLDMGSGIIKTMAKNDITARLGQRINFNYQQTLSKEKANIIALSTTTYLPSIFRNHSFEINFDYQQNTPNVYYFPNEVNFIRGVYGEFPTKYYGLKFNYHLPLSYPDLKLTKLLYIQRITARGFFDFGYFDNKYLSSIGTYIQMDFNILRIEYPLNIGIQMGYQPQNKASFAHLIFFLNI